VISVGAPGECGLCEQSAASSCTLEGRDERGQPDIREFDACTEHVQKIRAALRDPDRWDDVVAAAENKAAAMDLAQLARRGELHFESEPKIREVNPEGLVPPGYRQPEGLEPPGYGRGGMGDHTERMRPEFDWGPRPSEKDLGREIGRELW
jgi:hypothetical protein